MSYRRNKIELVASNGDQGWRGKEADEANPIRHRWQQARSADPLQQLYKQRRHRRLRVGVLMAIFLVATGGFLAAILKAPVRTPVLVGIATDYQWPLPPNAWAREDRIALSTLHGQTTTHVDLTGNWIATRELVSFRKQLRAIVDQNRSNSLIIYLSIHGAVDAQGRACLIPPHADVLNSGGWIPIEDLLTAIKSVETLRERKTLLVLDCNRMLVNWHIGAIYNRFATQLKSAVDAANIPNFAVLNSTSADEIGWASPEWGHSAFGYFFARGLAGHADRDEAYGNGDGDVSLGELTNYVRTQVQDRTMNERGRLQTPQLMQAGPNQLAQNVSLVSAVDEQLLADIDLTIAAAPANSPVDDLQLNKIWEQIGRLKQDSPIIRYSPLVWRGLQHQAIWLEQLVDAGSGYGEKADEVYDSLKKELAEITTRLETYGASKSVFDVWRIGSGRSVSESGLKVSTLALADYFGPLPISETTLLRERLAAFGATGSQTTLSAALQNVSPAATLTADIHFGRILDRYSAAQLWTDHTEILSAAMESRQMSETLSVPVASEDLIGDERAHRWIRELVARGDASRRYAEDLLIAGPGGQSALSPDSWSTAAADYEEAQKLVADVTKAYALCDHIASELPYLAAWSIDPLRDWTTPAAPSSQDVSTSTAANHREIVSQTTLRAIVDLKTLQATLALQGDLFAINDMGPMEQVRELYHQLSGDPLAKTESYQKLKTRFIERRADLIGCKTTTSNLRELEAALAVPSLLARARAELRIERNAIARKLHDAETTAVKKRNNEDDLAEVDYAAHLDGLQPHPAVALLHTQPLNETSEHTDEIKRFVDPNNPHRFEEAGQWIRSRLSASANVIESDADISSGAEADTDSSRRLALAKRVWLLRRAAPLAFRLPSENPVWNLRRLDLQQLLIWHKNRAVDDFWGPAGDREEAFFVLAAKANLDSADKIRPIGNLDEQKQQIDARRKSVEDWLTVKPDERVILLDTSAPATAEIRFSPSSSSLPVPGAATVLLRPRLGSEKRILDVPFSATANADVDTDQVGSSIALPLNENLQRHFKTSELRDHVGNVAAVATFRGHEAIGNFVVQDMSGVRVEFEPKILPTASVEVRSDKLQRPSVMFLLDCSQSMIENVPVEATRGNVVSRFDEAHSALRTMLSELESRTDARVGMRLYGHRIGWSTEQPDTVLRQHDYAGPIPESLTPSEDVELLLPIGRFDAFASGKVSRHLESVVPWGQSPLYYALTAAIADFANEDPTAQKNIVVITDGVNYQFTPPGTNNRPVTPTLRDDVVAAWQNQPGVSLYFVGFGASADNAAKQASEFNYILDKTRGEYWPVNESGALVNRLRDLLLPATYSVQTKGGEALAPANVGKPTTVAVGSSPAAATKITFRSAEQQITNEGGEALVFTLPDGDAFLRVPPYGHELAHRVALNNGDGKSPSGHFVAIERPRREAGGVRFPISIQNDVLRYTPRPVESWIEIMPMKLDDSLTGQKYIFYDHQFADNTPVPVHNWLATDWPSSARRAKIQTWFKTAATAPKLRIAVDSLIGGKTQKVDVAPGVTCELSARQGATGNDLVRIDVVEYHTTASAGMGVVKIALESPEGRGPVRVRRSFDAKNRVATHSFFFASDMWKQLGQDDMYGVLVTSRDATRQDAWQHEPVIIDVVGSGDLLQLNGPAK